MLNSKKYIPEVLRLSASIGGFIESLTSGLQKQCIKEISNNYGLSTQKYFNLLTTNDSSIPKYKR